jgi:hypothetical protein
MATTLQFPVRDRATPAESAKILKQALQKRFPAVRFSVRLGRGTGYGDCDVSWTDGPTVALVEPITWPFEGQTFDGMTDMREYTRAILPDGRQSGLKLILTQRNVSPALARKAAAQVAAYYGIPEPVITEYETGYWRVENDSVQIAGTHEYWGTLIHRAASDASRYRREGV